MKENQTIYNKYPTADIPFTSNYSLSVFNKYMCKRDLSTTLIHRLYKVNINLF